MPTRPTAVLSGLRSRLFCGALAGLAVMGLGCHGSDHNDPIVAPDPVAPPISVNPVDQTITSGQTATFSVVAHGAGGLAYQWTLNGNDIAGATASTYTTPAQTVSNSGAFYAVRVGTAYGLSYSRSALLTVVASGVVSPFAGSTGTPGSGNGSGAGASFNGPSAIASDSAGNLFVADTQNSIIRKITPLGAVSTFAGTAGVVGHADNTGAAASFDHPAGIAVDSAGTIYVADSGNRIIRKITPGGVVSTLAGTAGVYGHVDDTGPAASFAYPQGLTVDASGTVYVADTFNNTIRKITAAGVVSTLAGTTGVSGATNTSSGVSATFNNPTSLVLDPASGNLFVTDSLSQLIRVVSTTSGSVTTFAGGVGIQGRADGGTTDSRFWKPVAIAMGASGTFYVAEAGNRSIRKFVQSTGAVTTQAGSPTLTGTVDGTGSAASFRNPVGIAVDPTTGNVFVVDASDHIVRKLVPGS
jgi:sugar lactone lactonase YvrE